MKILKKPATAVNVEDLVSHQITLHYEKYYTSLCKRINNIHTKITCG